MHSEAAEARESWVIDRAETLLESWGRGVAVGLRRAAALKQLSQGERNKRIDGFAQERFESTARSQAPSCRETTFAQSNDWL
jgi:hypothetical protein